MSDKTFTNKEMRETANNANTLDGVSFEGDAIKVGSFLRCPAMLSHSLDNSEKAIEIAVKYGGIDGSHHKDWVIDQMVRALTGDDYERIVKAARGDDEYEWNEGIAP